MKKKMYFITIILIITITAGCSKPPIIDTSLSEETISESTPEIPSTMEKVIEKETKEEQNESFESDVLVAGESITEAASQNPISKPTTYPAEKQPPDAPEKSTTQPYPPPPESSNPPEPTVPAYTKKDFDEIIAVVREYAEIQTKLKFIWDPTLLMNEFSGWHDTPNLNKRGKDGIIRTLKYNVDLTVDVLTNPANGIISNTVHYNIVWYEINGETFFVLLYG